MPGIWNVNTSYNMNSKRVSSKLSFELGEAFLARIVSSDEEGKELLLKLLDGWQFTAKLEKSLEDLPKGLIRFQVMDFQEGKLIIKPVLVNESEDNKEKSSIDSLLEDQQLSVGKEDYDILKNMIKHNMPLTKENISKVKTIVDFKEKLEQNSDEGDSFVVKYMNSKGIDAGSEKGKQIADKLKGFFQALKSSNNQDIYVLIENGLELTEENLNSFNKLFKGEKSVYKSLHEVAGTIKEAVQHEKSQGNYFRDIKDNGNSDIIYKSNIREKGIEKGAEKGVEKSIENGSKGEIKEGNLNKTLQGNEAFEDNSIELLIKPKEVEIKNNTFKTSLEGNDQAENEIEVGNSESTLTKAFLSDDNEDMTLSQFKEIIAHERNKMDGDSSRVKVKLSGNEKEATAAIIKEELSSKGAELKSLIRGIAEDKLNLKPEIYNKIMENFKDTLNDFKVFNTVSNQYYYLDVPLNVRDTEYQCKLIIKDERKKGKKIDSKNVKLAVAVKTTHMGTVDSYIKISNNNMNVDIKCEEKWIKALELGKEKILRELSNMGYNINISVEKKETDISLASCRGFFEDSHLGSINTRV